MNAGRKTCSSPPEENPEQSERGRRTESRLKINRLKRSPKTTQTQRSDLNNSTAENDFKTPTRVPKLGFRSTVSDESPNYDSELQHEIIWDPTSPATPIRNGRGRRRTAAFKSVDISDIVNRIAPKNKRSEEAESTLLQWIGDTAIPCTPEIQKPRTKPKPPRQNPVEDLLKLAKQFDLNMFQQEEAHLHPDPQSSAEAMHEGEDLFFEENDPPALPQRRSKAERSALGSEDTKTNDEDLLDNPGPIQDMDDDLDLLFDGSTQQLSGGLSQGFSSRSQDAVTFTPLVGAKVDSVKSVTRVAGAAQSSAVGMRVATPTFRLGSIKQIGAADEFDDDWNNDDLLDDSLVMEMTQNPELFSAPQCSSTQKQTNENNVFRRNNKVESKSGESQRFSQRLSKATGNENVQKSGSNLKTQVFPSNKVPSMVSASYSVSQPKKPIENQQRLATTSANTTLSSSLVTRSYTPRSVPSTTTDTAPSFRINKITKENENPPAVDGDVLCDFAAEDLDSIFASDDIWDDGADDDDDLFCEVCEKVEESMAEPEPPPKASVSKPTPQSSRVQGTQNTTSKLESRFTQPSSSNPRVYNHGAPDSRAPPSTEALPGRHHKASAVNNSTVTLSEKTYRFSRVKSTTGTGSDGYNTARQVSGCTTATAGQSYQRIQDDHQFKKPYSTFNAAPAVSKDVSKAVVTRCSDAEIERKKQQAMERRRLRMLASQNLQAPV